jgi:hypothetical protein
MTARKRVLILSFSYLNRDPRVNRQIRFLKDRYEVVCAGVGPPLIDGVDFIRIDWNEPTPPESKRQQVRLMRRHYEEYYWRYPFVADAAEKLGNVRADLVLANDIDALPLCLKIGAGAPVIFDAHEFAPLEFEDLLWFWKLHRGYRQYLCQTYIPRATCMLTVCQGLAGRYRREFGANPLVMLNAPLFEHLEPSPLTPGRVRLIHHGGAMVSRKMERTIEMMRHLDRRFELYFMLVDSNPDYLKRLKELARRTGRTYFLPPVPMPKIPSATNQFDLGVFLLPPVNFNYRHALPNKLFEYIQARLGIAVGPSPEMAAVVRRRELGVVSQRFDPWSLARQLNRLSTDDIMRFKHNAHRAAEHYSSLNTKTLLLDTVDRLLSAPSAGGGTRRPHSPARQDA